MSESISQLESQREALVKARNAAWEKEREFRRKREDLDDRQRELFDKIETLNGDAE